MLSWAEVVAATGGVSSGPAPEAVGSVVIDSRKVVPGCLYVCLKGERFDGHDFASQALESGAVAVVVAESWAGELPGSCVLRVPDTLVALGHLGRAWRRKLGLKVVAVTGSSGKTSTKEATAAYLSAWGPVLKTEANYNNEVGVPLTLLSLKPEHAMAVVEMGMRGPGEIAYLAELAEPDVGLITNVGTAHLGRLGSREALAEAKAELWRHMPSTSVAVVNGDDALCWGQATAWGGRRLTFGLSDEAADVVAGAAVHEQGGQRFEVQWRSLDGQRGNSSVWVPLWGDHHRANALSALAAGLALGLMPPSEVSIAPEALPGRFHEMLVAGVTIVDDAYNANPDSMAASLKAFCERPAAGRRYAVLGDMGELGTDAPDAHRAVGDIAASLPLASVLAVGTLAVAYAAGHSNAEHFASGEAACQSLAERLKPGDQVLFKASRAARFENLVSCLKQHLGA